MVEKISYIINMEECSRHCWASCARCSGLFRPASSIWNSSHVLFPWKILLHLVQCLVLHSGQSIH